MRIGVDICNTLADVNGAIAQVMGLKNWHPKTYGLNTLGLAPDQQRRFFQQHPQVFAEAQPLSGAQEALNKLAANHEIRYVTSRPLWARKITQRWLQQHGFPDAQLVMGIPKIDAVVLLGLEAFVEDDPAEIKKLSRVIPVFSPAWSYNDSKLNWTDIEAMLLKTAC